MAKVRKITGRKCPVSKKSPMFGHKVSHAQNKTKRKFNVGLYSKTLHFVVNGNNHKIRVRISHHAYRTIDKIRNTEGEQQAYEFVLQQLKAA
jgi:large subunit ribosomal protein L28